MRTKNYLKLLASLLLGLALAACGPAATPTAAPTVVRPIATPSPSRRATLTVLGYSLTMACQGEGRPTVVLDSGVRGEGQSWIVVQDKLKLETRVCSYMRNGDVDPLLTLADMTRDLHAVLAEIGETGPYVLVGQSFAGMRVRMFADRYPTEVVGLVLVDSDHEEAGVSDAAVLPPPSPNDSETLQAIRAQLAVPDSGVDPTVDYVTSTAQMRTTVGNLGDLPLFVLTADHQDWDPDFEPEVAALLYQSWLKIQEREASLSTNSVHHIVADSGHNIQIDQPAVVVDAILQVLTAARTGDPLADQ